MAAAEPLDPWAPSTPASRFMKPDWKLREPCRAWPSSIESCVSKWLREVSSVPAKGTNAACFFSNSGSTLSRRAGLRAQSASSGSAASAAVPGLATAMFGRCS